MPRPTEASDDGILIVVPSFVDGEDVVEVESGHLQVLMRLWRPKFALPSPQFSKTGVLAGLTV